MGIGKIFVDDGLLTSSNGPDKGGYVYVTCLYITANLNTKNIPKANVHALWHRTRTNVYDHSPRVGSY